MSISNNPVVFVCIVIGSIIFTIEGKPPSRLRGGEDAKLGQVPWTVAISYSSHPVPECGGAIISPRHILTAGHCVVDGWSEELIVRSGFVNIFDNSTVVRHVSNFYIHTHYNDSDERGEIKNDLAVLVLKEDLPIGHNNLIQIIPLPSNQTDEQFGVVAGWGQWSTKKRFNVPINLQIAVVWILDEILCSVMNRRMPMPEFLCGVIRAGNTLSGDSGNPLTDSNGVLVGIQSSGRGIPGLPDAYVNVYHYLGWIKSIID